MQKCRHLLAPYQAYDTGLIAASFLGFPVILCPVSAWPYFVLDLLHGRLQILLCKVWRRDVWPLPFTTHFLLCDSFSQCLHPFPSLIPLFPGPRHRQQEDLQPLEEISQPSSKKTEGSESGAANFELSSLRLRSHMQLHYCSNEILTFSLDFRKNSTNLHELCTPLKEFLQTTLSFLELL